MKRQLFSATHLAVLFGFFGATFGGCHHAPLPCAQTPALRPTTADDTEAAAPAARSPVSISESADPSVAAAHKREADGVLDAFHAAAAVADEAAYFALFAKEGVFLGTDASERWSVSAFRDYVHPHFSGGRGWKYAPRDRHIRFAGEVAWFDELLDHEKYGELRGSGVLVREANAWRIAQYNLTFTVPNQAAGQVVPLLRAAPKTAPKSAP